MTRDNPVIFAMQKWWQDVLTNPSRVTRKVQIYRQKANVGKIDTKEKTSDDVPVKCAITPNALLQ